MTFLQRVWFRMTNDPASDKAWKKQREENKAACDPEINEWNRKLSYVTDPNFTKTALPEDVAYFTKFIKERIKKLKTYTLSATDIDTLNTSQESEHFNTMTATFGKRFEFKSGLDGALTHWKAMIQDLKDKKKTVPPSYPKLIVRIEHSLAWFGKQKFVEAEVYSTELKNLSEDANVILRDTGGDLHDPEMSKKVAEDADDAARNEFSISRLIAKILAVVFTIFNTFIIFVGGVYGSSLATNLNLHHSAAYRVFYAIFGFLFFFIVIPYVLLYRWWWKGKKPRFYSLIPLVPYHFDNYYTGLLLSWMSYKPDDRIQALKEWELEHKI